MMKKYVLVLTAGLVGLVAVFLLLSHKAPPEDLAALFERYHTNGLAYDLDSPFSGAVLIAKGDSVLLKGAYGWYDREKEIPLTVPSRFMIGSITKSFTALLILQQVEAGTLRLDQTVSEFLPSFPNEKGDQLTIHRLLSHTSGLPHYEGFLALGFTPRTFQEKVFTPEEYAALIARMPLINTPGTQYHYSSPGYVLLAVILETVTGKSYRELLEAYMTEPLGLNNTGYADNEYVETAVAKDYRFEEYGWLKALFSSQEGAYEDGAFRDQSNTYAAGGMHSTVEDLFIWVQALRANKVLSPEMTTKMFQPNEQGYGYGWQRNPEEMLRRNHQVQLSFHGGATRSYRALVALYDDGTTIIVLTNVEPLDRTALLLHTHLQANDMEKVQKDLIHPSLRNLPHFIEEGGLHAFETYHRVLSERAGYLIMPSSSTMQEVVEMYLAGDRFDEITAFMKRFTETYEVTEEVIHGAGYGYLGAGYHDEAIRYFQLNVEQHPLSANAFDSLGEGFEAGGDYERALESYRRAVVLGERHGDTNLDLYRAHVANLEEKMPAGSSR